MSESVEEDNVKFLRENERKWQKKWDDAHIFNSEPDKSKPKFFANYPYSYMNGRPHVGHTFTLMRVELFSRYKRMRGYNVLFPFAFHWTGTPIGAAAQRIKSGEQKQIEILKEMGVPEDKIPEFSEPLKWTNYFTDIWETEIRKIGMSIDWRRKFHTTDQNPYYDKFVAWQFRKLKSLGYVALGSHPVIWCPNDNVPVGDADRVSAENERVTPVEYTLLKFKCDDFYLVAATLRPETIYGQTNLWILPDVEYLKIKVKDETWVVSKECLPKLKAQGHEDATEIGSIKGRDIIGKKCIAPGIDREIPVLPSKFCDVNMGTGIVTSVPSDAPDDWMALSDLQKSKEECVKYGLNWDEVNRIKPIAIIKSKGFGDLPAVEVCKDLGILDQNDKVKLEKAKEIVYKAGFYTGVMNDNCGDYSGMTVSDAKDIIKQRLLKEGKADRMYEPSADVTCRCLTKAIVKLVSNQWFITYGNKDWKYRVKIALNGGLIDGKTYAKMNLYPEGVRKQFQYITDWLEDWACTREYGLGSHLPWDNKWVIESLSDSTIYMAYYTISKYLQYMKVITLDNLTDELFDYIFSGKGNPDEISRKSKLAPDILKQMRDEFDYWYPFDFRNSGKELVQNHLIFCVFNHVAIFPPDKWPRGIGVNGWMLLNGQKMSKSQGNTLFLGEALTKYGADGTRFALAHAGEGVDDPIFDTDFALSATGRLIQWFEFAKTNYNKGRVEESSVDRWFDSRMNILVRETMTAMDETKFRTALKTGYFDLQSAFRWYSERCGSLGLNKNTVNRFTETQTLVLAPFTPHICEEIWETLGKKGFISVAEYPTFKSEKVDESVLSAEDFLKSVIEDTFEILKIFKGTPKKIVYYTSPEWKHIVFSKARTHFQSGNADIGSLIKDLMSELKVKQYAKDVPKYAQKCVEDFKKMGEEYLNKTSIKIDELRTLEEAKEFLGSRLGVEIEIHPSDEMGLQDPGGKAKQAAPMRPGIYII